MRIRRARSFLPSRRTLRALFFGTLLLGCSIGALSGCGADNLFDCQSVCSRYKDCFDNTFDVGMCRDRCRERSKADPNVEHQADVCQACIDGQSCAGATFMCAADCNGIVPF